MRDTGHSACHGEDARSDPYARAYWLQAVDRIYSRMRLAAKDGPYNTTCNGIALTVLPEVYAPGFFTDTEWFSQQLPDLISGNTLLEIGPGTGIHAISCALRGVNSVAIDINPHAVENSRLNAEKLGVRVDVRLGDVYSSLRDDERFDTIFWAHPFNKAPVPVHNFLCRSGFDHNYEGVKRYIRNGKQHLTSQGTILLGTGNTADLDTIFQTARQAGYQQRLLRKALMSVDGNGGPAVEYLIYEFK